MSEKYDKCAYKSAEQYTRKVKICCNNYKDVTAYDCEKREIFPLAPNHCEACQEFKAKESL